jgi:hypothetical protein
MVAKLGKGKSSVPVHGFLEQAVVLDHLRVVGFDHALPGSVIGMDGQFPQNDQSATAFSTPGIIGHMAIREGPLLAEVSPVGEKADAIGKDGLT